MTLKQYFTKDYFFNTNITFISKGDKIFLLLGIVFIILAIVIKLAVKLSPTEIDKKFRAKLFNPFLTLGIWEVLWYGFRWQQIYFFGSNFVAWLGFLICAIWLISVLINIFKNYKTEKQLWERQQLKQKYLPK